MSERKPTPAERYPIEENYPRTLSSREIDECRYAAREEAMHVLYLLHAYRYEDARENPTIHGGYSTAEQREARRHAFMEQLRVCEQYLQEELAVDEHVCGREHANALPSNAVCLKVEGVSRNGTYGAKVHGRNSWGSLPLEQDPQMQARLRAESGGDEERYKQAAAAYKRNAQTADQPILSESDHVEVYDEHGALLGAASVVEAGTQHVNLRFETPMRLTAGHRLRRRSRRTLLKAYEDCVHKYDFALDSAETGFEFRAPLTTVEKQFFGVELDHYEAIRAVQEQDSRNFQEEDIPTSLAGDPEQAAAFALGAMGHPCILIQGPPGTGKTQVASELANYFQGIGLKTLVLSHSNRGVDVLLETIQKKGARVHRSGTDAAVCTKRMREPNVFIRHGLTRPRREDFNTTTSASLNEAAYAAAVQAYRQQMDDVVYRLLYDEEGAIVGQTLNSFPQDEITRRIPFDVVIVDEATKGRLHELLPAVEAAGKQIIFIGDQKQLGNVSLTPHLRAYLSRKTERHNPASPTPSSDNTRTVEDFEGGPFVYLQEQCPDMVNVMLRTNRRALRDLVRLVSHAMYDGKLKAGRLDEDHPENFGTLHWIDVSKRPDKGDESAGLSMQHPLEARLLVRKVMHAFDRNELTPENFGVIAMYDGQARLILKKGRQTHSQLGAQGDSWFQHMLEENTDTVDAFQGGERDNIFLSVTRSNDAGGIGHVSDCNRLNVGMSRARDALYVFADRQTLIDDNPDPESKAFFTIVWEMCSTHGSITDTFPNLPQEYEPEEKKLQTRNARYKRKRRRKQRETSRE